MKLKTQFTVLKIDKGDLNHKKKIKTLKNFKTKF